MAEQVGYLSMRTALTSYTITIPDVTFEQMQEIIDNAALAATADEVFCFEFKNEKLSILVTDPPLNIHFFIKEENYMFPGPTVLVYPN